MSAVRRRLCLVADVEGYSRHPAPAQADLQVRLEEALRAGLRGAGIARWRVRRQDRGDGALLVLPVGVDEARAVPGLLRGLATALDDDAGPPRMRLRVVLTQGAVREAPTGFVGRAVLSACRVVDADAGRAELRRDPDALAVLMIAEDLFDDVLGDGYGGDELSVARFRRLVVPVKGEAAVPVRTRVVTRGALGSPVVAAAGLSVASSLVPTGVLLAEYLAVDDEVPDDEVPDDEVPDDEVPDDEVPDDEVPDDEVPDDEVPNDEVPVHDALQHDSAIGEPLHDWHGEGHHHLL